LKISTIQNKFSGIAFNARMCTNFTATRNNPWVKEHLAVDLPSAPYPLEAYPGYVAPLVLKSHSTGRVPAVWRVLD
jgi:hypothetical protein